MGNKPTKTPFPISDVSSIVQFPASDKILEWALNELKRAENELINAAGMIERLQKAGKNVAALQRKYIGAKEKLERYKEAFKD